MSRFPRPGPAGCRSPDSTVLSRHYDFLPPVSRRFVAFARRYHVIALVFSLSRGKCHHASLELVTRYLRPGSSSVETTGPPKFLGNPNHPFAHALRLRRDGSLQTNFRATAWPSLRERQRLSQRDTYEAQSHGFRTHCLRFVTLVTSRNARLASGRRSNATGRASHPQGHNRRFQIHVMSIFLLRQASWRNPRFDFTRFIHYQALFYFIIRANSYFVTNYPPRFRPQGDCMPSLFQKCLTESRNFIPSPWARLMADAGEDFLIIIYL